MLWRFALRRMPHGLRDTFRGCQNLLLPIHQCNQLVEGLTPAFVETQRLVLLAALPVAMNDERGIAGAFAVRRNTGFAY